MKESFSFGESVIPPQENNFKTIQDIQKKAETILFTESATREDLLFIIEHDEIRNYPVLLSQVIEKTNNPYVLRKSLEKISEDPSKYSYALKKFIKYLVGVPEVKKGLLSKLNVAELQLLADSDVSGLKKEDIYDIKYECTDLSEQQKTELQKLNINVYNQTENNQFSYRGQWNVEDANEPLKGFTESLSGNLTENAKIKDKKGPGLGYAIGERAMRGNAPSIGIFTSPFEDIAKGYPFRLDEEKEMPSVLIQFKSKKNHPVIISRNDAEKISPYKWKNMDELKITTEKFKELGIDAVIDRGELFWIDAENQIVSESVYEHTGGGNNKNIIYKKESI